MHFAVIRLPFSLRLNLRIILASALSLYAVCIRTDALQITNIGRNERNLSDFLRITCKIVYLKLNFTADKNLVSKSRVKQNQSSNKFKQSTYYALLVRLPKNHFFPFPSQTTRTLNILAIFIELEVTAFCILFKTSFVLVPKIFLICTSTSLHHLPSTSIITFS